MSSAEEQKQHVATIPTAVLEEMVKDLVDKLPTSITDGVTGVALVAHLVAQSVVGFNGDGERFGQMMLNQGALKPANDDNVFSSTNSYIVKPLCDGEASGPPVIFGDFFQSGWSAEGRQTLFPVTKAMTDLKPSVPVADDANEEIPLEKLEVLPADVHNDKLISQVHPIGQEDRNPHTEEEYDMLVIGSGAGGLVTSSGCSRHGAKTALIEYNLMGGDCLNIGCVPSKALLACARAVHSLRRASEFGIVAAPPKVDFGKVMERMRKLRAQIAHMDSIQRFRDTLGVEVLFGYARFTSPHTVDVGGKTYRFKKATIATGGSAFVPPIPGLADVPFLTNANLYNLTTLPPRFGVIGAGPIGIEMAQAFTRMGSEVVVLDNGVHILAKEDADASKLVHEQMVGDGTKFHLGVRVQRISQEGAKGEGHPITVHYLDGEGKECTLEVDQLLLSTGRKPNVKGLGLEKAGVAYDLRKGVTIDDYLVTSQPHIYAVGDACSMYQFTHMAGGMGGICWKNSMFGAQLKVSEMVLPWVTYTDPEVAHVGLYGGDCEARGIEYDTLVSYHKGRDRNIVDDTTAGFCKIIVRKGHGEILGATIVGHGAGDMITEITLAILSKTKAHQLASIITAYPTSCECITACGWGYAGQRMTPTLKSMMVEHSRGNL